MWHQEGGMSAIAEATTELTGERSKPWRAGRYSDIDLVHGRLMEAIATSTHYGEEFKAYEKARLTKDFLAGLIALDPYHVLIIEHEAKPGAFMLSGPELGTLWLYWSYVFPEARKSRLGFAGIGYFLRQWDNGRFHKVATYTKAGNDAAAALMLRYGFKHTTTLEKHIFGEDFLLYERFLNKVEPGYDRGVPSGPVNKLRYRLKRLTSR